MKAMLSRRFAVATATTALIAGALAVPSPAAAEPAITMDAAAAGSLLHTLGDRTGGTYLDRASGRMVVTVTDDAAADSVREAGGVPKVVKYSGTRLRAVTSRLDATPDIPGTAWAVDPVANQVVVSADSSVSDAQVAELTAAVAADGDAVRVVRVEGTFSTRIAGGDAIYAAGGRCSLGFNVRKDDADYFLTAGHCGNIADTWYSDQAHTAELGTTQESSFPGNDYALIKHTDGAAEHPSAVDLYNGSSQEITGAAEAFVGESVQRSGSTTRVHDGEVTAIDATVTYSEGRVSGLIQTTVCAEPGDSGGSLFAGPDALGLTSGGSGNCTTGGTTFFQPVTEALSVFGVTIGG